jgi:hypothetical protein
MTLFLAYQDRGLTKDITVTTAAGVAISVGANDKLRAIIGREGRLESDLSGALLVVTSDAPTANGSSFLKNTPSSTSNRLRLEADDLDFEPGTYSLFIEFLDHADGDEWKNVSRQVFRLERT